ncbi:MAG: hypothetical protein ACLPWG_18835 [Steroidobacteraceae bacterium]
MTRQPLLSFILYSKRIKETRWRRKPVSDPQAYRLRDAQDPCLTFFVSVDAFCERPNRYLFWDGIHPTVVGHEILEDAAQQVLHAR